ncbi:MAG: Uma2 family endonuclease, partial [Gemmatimonadales bacterium]|nr:Uma2 family endonuclease [Gemmatimonadales bacterium]
AVQHYYTAADLLDFPEDGNKYEVVHGELLVSPSPRMGHQRIVMRLGHVLAGYLRGEPVGEAFPGGDVHWGPDSLVIPDLLVVDRESARSGDWKQMATPLLVVEVLSPSSTRQDRFVKRRLYQEMEVPLYWMVDADAQVVEAWTPQSVFPTTEREVIRWHPKGATEPLAVQLGELFREM